MEVPTVSLVAQAAFQTVEYGSLVVNEEDLVPGKSRFHALLSRH